MKEIEKEFIRHIIDYRFKYKHRGTIKLGVLCSAGVDSSVLLYIANRFKSDLNLDITILYIMFNDFASHNKAHNLIYSYSNVYKNRLYTNTCDLASLTSGIKETARDAIKDISFSDNYDLVLTGHHFDDQIETFFMRVLRGSGLSGLSCMDTFSAYHKNSQIRVFGKPFINIRKDDIKQYALDNYIEYIEDESNQLDTHSDRNYIRNNIIPMLEHRFNINNIGILINNIKTELDNTNSNIINIDIYSGKWHVNEFIKLSVGNRIFIIREYLRNNYGYILSKKVIDHLTKKLDEDLSNFRVDLNSSLCVYIDDEYIVVNKK